VEDLKNVQQAIDGFRWSEGNACLACTTEDALQSWKIANRVHEIPKAPASAPAPYPHIAAAAETAIQPPE
jgi:hypothetical protein